MLSSMGTQVHMQELAPNSRIPFLPNVKIAMPPLVLFVDRRDLGDRDNVFPI